ncbi:SPOR domain-containing protein [Candidatus Paracaedibacter symbiosus]|uniref:SPOR domain-containing protein n=1 Tax=Candidatus Paracaedibacter symbiosus TaxID=244582 RepID=UPI0005099035|nr:SPOR domain-containing protein [Candidatus Paracaedibacter symbiosus]
MGPFTQRSTEREDQNVWERPEREFSLRASFNEEESQPSRFEFAAEREGPEGEHRPDRDIRNLGFFKEQERQFTQTEDEEEWQERQSPINFVLIACIFLILCVVGWFGYRWASNPHHSEPPLIKAEPTPFKVRPDNPGGMVIPHQDKLIYGRIAPEQHQPIEHLLPAPEQPIAPPSPEMQYPGQPQTFVDANGQIYYAYPAPHQPPAQVYQAPQHDPAAGYTEYSNPAGNAYPQAMQPQPMAPQQQGTMPPSAAGQQPYPTVPVTQPIQQGYPAPPGYAPAPTTSPVQQAPLQPLVQQQQLPSVQHAGMAPAQQPLPVVGHQAGPPMPTPIAAPPPHTETATPDKDVLDQLIEQEMGITVPAAPTPQKATDKPQQKIATGPYKVQVATVETKADAEKEVKRIKGIDQNLFTDKTLSIQEVIISGNKKPSYRVIIGGFGTPNAAAQFSNKLKIHKVKGIVLHQPN